MDVRRADLDDLPALLRLVEAYWDLEGIAGFDHASAAEQIRFVLSKPDLGCIWIALAEKDVVGYIIVVHVFSLEHVGLTAEIDELFVEPACRRQGVGRALLEAAEEWSVRAGCRNLSLQVGRDNDAARNFYTRLGLRRRTGFELMEKDLHAEEG